MDGYPQHWGAAHLSCRLSGVWITPRKICLSFDPFLTSSSKPEPQVTSCSAEETTPPRPTTSHSMKHISSWVTTNVASGVATGKEFASRASSRASFSTVRGWPGSISSSNNLSRRSRSSRTRPSISAPTEFRHLTEMPDPAAAIGAVATPVRRRRESFRPLELSIYLPSGRLSPLPDFTEESWDCAVAGLRAPEKAVVRDDPVDEPPIPQEAPPVPPPVMQQQQEQQQQQQQQEMRQHLSRCGSAASSHYRIHRKALPSASASSLDFSSKRTTLMEEDAQPLRSHPVSMTSPLPIPPRSSSSASVVRDTPRPRTAGATLTTFKRTSSRYSSTRTRSPSPCPTAGSTSTLNLNLPAAAATTSNSHGRSRANTSPAPSSSSSSLALARPSFSSLRGGATARTSDVDAAIRELNTIVEERRATRASALGRRHGGSANASVSELGDAGASSSSLVAGATAMPSPPASPTHHVPAIAPSMRVRARTETLSDIGSAFSVPWMAAGGGPAAAATKPLPATPDEPAADDAPAGAGKRRSVFQWEDDDDDDEMAAAAATTTPRSPLRQRLSAWLKRSLPGSPTGASFARELGGKSAASIEETLAAGRAEAAPPVPFYRCQAGAAAGAAATTAAARSSTPLSIVTARGASKDAARGIAAAAPADETTQAGPAHTHAHAHSYSSSTASSATSSPQTPDWRSTGAPTSASSVASAAATTACYSPSLATATTALTTPTAPLSPAVSVAAPAPATPRPSLSLGKAAAAAAASRAGGACEGRRGAPAAAGAAAVPSRMRGAAVVGEARSMAAVATGDVRAGGGVGVGVAF
ncbi:hypothetical protein BDY21DRAFT_394517 [Lineolata rhizophorae]|uniref:Uncharacterized protein n=1 Tax=Lineolata rhizophorae TaxID=578093 RepID=A0A6A6NWE8_9PEZI|nr:hypothetical protein BDY21DRAFT_394517 [Lineolata rhizophorae]